jgi:predicted AAA+ superfamily ATPase
MEEMAIYGGYPAVLTTGNHNDRLEELEEIYLSYIKKDIIDFLKVGRSEAFNHLVKVLASQVGNLVNKSEICSVVGSNAITVTKYMTFLQETYITAYLPPFVSSKRSEIKSAHKCFFIDNGLRNYVVRQFNALSHRTDKGALMENMIFTELVKDYKLLKEELFYWRSKGGAEMDFVLKGESGIVPVEIKSGPARPGLLSRSFHAFLDFFSPPTAIFLNRDLFHIEKVKQTRVYYLPHHWFLLFGPGLIKS